MTGIDWTIFAQGLALGAVIGAAYFAGLALGIRLALRAARPTAFLLLSAGLRMAVLLAAGWLAAQIGAECLAGFALAFLLARFVSIRIARRDRTGEPAAWN